MEENLEPKNEINNNNSANINKNTSDDIKEPKTEKVTKINENKNCCHTRSLTAYDARLAALATPGSRLLSL